MKGKTMWQERPHRSAHEADGLPVLCRLAPGKTGVELEWLDESAGPWAVEWRGLYENEPWQSMPAATPVARLEGLAPYRDYEVRIARADGTRGAARLFRAAPVPGTVIHHLHSKDLAYACSGRALCSPSLVKLPSGALLASMDVFAPGGPQNLTLLFRSDDLGKSWRYVCDLFPLFWGNLFAHNGRLYAMGCSTEFGDLLIGASDDEGRTWTLPTRLFCGSSTVGHGWQQGTMPVLRHAGRIWACVEYAGRGIDTYVSAVSAPEDCDLLDAGNWTATRPVNLNPQWPGAPAGRLRGMCEGNLVVDRAGTLVSILRLNMGECRPDHGKAVVLRADALNPEKPLDFVRFIDMPSGGNSKTYIRYDPVSDRYVAIGNLVTHEAAPFQRSVVALLSSRDAYEWHTDRVLLDYGLERDEEAGFQYPSFLIEGEDILCQLRTALNGARNYHDANYSTFHVFENFRAALV